MKERRSRKGLLITLAVILIAAACVVGFVKLKETPGSGLTGKRVLLAGDSRSSTDYTFYKDTLEKKTGCTALVKGASGKTAAYNASDAYLDEITSTEHDFSIWLVGGNDDGSEGSIGTFAADSPLGKGGEKVVPETDITKDYDGETFIQAIDHMMRKYRAAYAQRGDGKAPVMIFCTDLPQQRDSKDSPWSRQENWERKREAILECCEKNGVQCLDLYEKCGFEMEKEPMYTEPTDREHDRGKFYMDGLHPNAKGIDRITDLEIAAMETAGETTGLKNPAR